MGWLEGDVALITGAGSGLGRALVDRFVAEGARVAAVDRAPERVASVEEAYPGTVTGIVADVTVADDNEQAVAHCLDVFGKLDTFIGNAGMFDYRAGIADTPIEALDKAFDELFAINVKACLLGTKAALPALVDSGGSVILTASMSSRHAGIGGAVYTASKHAVAGLVRQLAYELAPRVRVNGVAPGFMRTDIRGPQSLGMGEQTPAPSPTSRSWRAPPCRWRSCPDPRTTPATTSSSPREPTPQPPPASSSPPTAASTCEASARRPGRASGTGQLVRRPNSASVQKPGWGSAVYPPLA